MAFLPLSHHSYGTVWSLEVWTKTFGRQMARQLIPQKSVHKCSLVPRRAFRGYANQKEYTVLPKIQVQYLPVFERIRAVTHLQILKSMPQSHLHQIALLWSSSKTSHIPELNFIRKHGTLWDTNKAVSRGKLLTSYSFKCLCFLKSKV